VIRWLGALMIVLSCTSIGLLGQKSMQHRIDTLKDAETIVEILRLHICIRGLPLPSVLEELERKLPERFSGASQIYGTVRDVPFAGYWQACLQAAGIGAESVEILGELVEELVGGQTPERALNSARQRLARAMSNAVNIQRERGRLPLAFGAAGGCVLVLILL